MDIIWHGHSFFEIQAKVNGNNTVIAIDPYDKTIGFREKKVKADILLISHFHYDHSNLNSVEGRNPNEKPFLIDEPGEYEVKGIKIKGISSFHDNQEGKERGENNIFLIEAEEIKICHMGDFGQSSLSSEQAEEIVGVDILLIPVGGVYTISGKEAAKIVGQIEPKIVIPMHYKIPGLKINLDDENKFLNVIGVKEKEKIRKLKIKKSDLERKEGTEVIIMEKF